MPQSERWQKIGREILFSARTELYMGLPFLDEALSALAVTDGGYDTDTLATDAKNLYFSGAWLAMQLEHSRTSVNRAYLHSVFHCLLRHPAKSKNRDTPLWDLACDIAVESMLDSLEYRCVQADKPSIRRKNTYRRLRQSMPVLTAEAVYRQFRRERLNSYDCATLARVFQVDDHSLWETSDDDEQDKQWQQTAERTQTAMETIFTDQSTGGEAVREQLSVSAHPTTDYRAFLRRFAALREEVAIDADSFDYGYYAYGLRHYGNMPLIEPLEYKETDRVRDFAIVIDTSESVSGDLVRRFITHTFDILKSSQDYATTVNIHVVQCDAKVQSDLKITDLGDVDKLMEGFVIRGFGGTDFRPAFDYVEMLRKRGEFADLKGLIYFTDGLGQFPEKTPDYDAAFVFMDEEGRELPPVPPWAMKVVVDEAGLSQLDSRSA